MKKLIAISFLGLLTAGSLVLTIPFKADSAVYCQTRVVNGRYVTCCIDSYGNWACVK